jgi:hypothetical protein
MCVDFEIQAALYGVVIDGFSDIIGLYGLIKIPSEFDGNLKNLRYLPLVRFDAMASFIAQAFDK